MISPDLSTQDASRIGPSGGLVGDNLGQFAPEVIFAIATSEVEKGLIWAGTNDGKIWYTRDGGQKWNDVTKNVTGLPAWGVISKIEPSHFNGGTAYVAVDAHLMDSREPYIFKTTDYGATWKRVNGDLPNAHPLSYVKAVAENPNKAGMIFAGTGHGFFYSDRRRRPLDRTGGGAAARPGELDRRAETISRRGDLDLRTRALCARRHHAARAGDAGDNRRGRASLLAAIDVPLVAAQPRADQLLAEKRAARGRSAPGRSTARGRSFATCGRRRMPA